MVRTILCFQILTELVFCLPFSLLQYMQTSRLEKYGLICTFLLGAITLTTGILRFIWVDIDWHFSPSGKFCNPKLLGTTNIIAIWCSGEMCASIIVVNLPTLKCLFKKKTTISTIGYMEKHMSLSQCTTNYMQSHWWNIILPFNSQSKMAWILYFKQGIKVAY